MNRNVRQAINYAINKQDIVDTYFSGFGEPMNTLIPSSVNFGNESYPGYPFNISYANFLLDSSGFLKDSDGYRFSLDLSGLTLLTDYNDLLNTIRNNLELVGIQINILEHNNYERYYSGEYDIYIIGVSDSYDPGLVRHHLHSDGDFNTGNYFDPVIEDLIVLGESSPIKQEREFYYSLIQSMIQFDAPLLFLSNIYGRFALANNMSSLVTLDKQMQIVFNFTLVNSNPTFKFLSGNGNFNSISESETNEFEYKDISMPEYSLYFPETDTVLETVDKKPFTVTVKTTNQIQNFIPLQSEEGKFYSITVSDNSMEYYLRVYYDLDEIDATFPLENLGLNQWIENSNSWQDLVSISSNNSLRFVEVQLSGNAIIKFGEVLHIGKLTFQFLPVSIVFFLGICGVIVLIVRGNIKFLIGLRERYKL